MNTRKWQHVFQNEMNPEIYWVVKDGVETNEPRLETISEDIAGALLPDCPWICVVTEADVANEGRPILIGDVSYVPKDDAGSWSSRDILAVGYSNLGGFQPLCSHLRKSGQDLSVDLLFLIAIMNEGEGVLVTAPAMEDYQ